MSTVLAIVRREVHAYFVSPIAYTVMVIFLLATGIGFMRAMVSYSLLQPSVIEDRDLSIRTWLIAQNLAVWIKSALVFCLPALSMRTFSEERKGGTAELLLTSPLTTRQLVLGKFLATLSVLGLLLAATLIYPILVSTVGVVEWPALGAAYLGLVLYGAAVLAVGLFASSLSENQIVALLLTYAIFLPFMLIKLLTGLAGPLSGLLSRFSMDFGLQLMALGLVDSHYVVLHLVVIFTFLFLCVQVLDSNRWR